MQLQSLPATIAAESLQLFERPFSYSESKVASLAGLSFFTFLLHGYHPYAQDASIYVAGVEKQLNPSLFLTDAAFVEGHTRLSIFSHLIAALVQSLHASLDLVLLLIYLASVVAFLAGCYSVARRIFASDAACWGATVFAAICFTMPAAATSLLMMDPYVTARSITTPLSLFAITACLDHAWKRMLVLASLTVIVHPLMGIYLASFLAILFLLQQRRRGTAAMFCAGTVLVCAVTAMFGAHDAITPAYREAALSRTYYFLASWQWYEIAGLVAPLALMGLAATRSRTSSATKRLCITCLFTGITACLISYFFVHTGHPNFLMRVQVLRSFHTVYVLGVIMLGGLMGSYTWMKNRWLGAMLLLLIATAGMYFGDRQSYPTVAHVEWPGAATDNPWDQAFHWIRANTPPDAIFAADSQTFNAESEDSLGFRAITKRSILTDAKDEGVVSLFPALAPEWSRRRDAQRDLDHISDGDRMRRLAPYHVDWMILAAGASTSFTCPYHNAAVAVCRVER